jgi:predicted acetyltransferase
MNRIISYNIKEIRQLFENQNHLSNTYLSDLKILLKIAESKKDKIVFLALKQKNSIVAAGLFSEEKRKVLGLNYSTLFLYGYCFFDYNKIFITPSIQKDFFSFLRSFSIPKGIDLILLENIKEKIEESVLITFKSHICSFDANISEDGFDFIKNKKSLKRHRNKLLNNFNYSIVHLQGEDITELVLLQLENLHKERWVFDNIKSAFYQKDRAKFYNAEKQNRVISIISLDKEVFAMHYGILKNDKLIWHTPVLNIKYLAYSPIEVLLYETAEFCSKNGMITIDYGIGNENYKNRFSNKEEDLFQYYFPVNLKTRAKIYLGNFLKNIVVKMNIRSILEKVYSRFKNISNSILLYKIEKKNDPLINNETSVRFIKITNYHEFVDFARKQQKQIKRFHYNRFLNSEYFLCLLKENTIICDGWATQNPLLISEINKTFQPKSGYILYDYNTPRSFRRKGYYKSLLRHIINEFDTDLYIYSLKENIASNKAISSVGFKKIKEKILQ